MASLRGEGASAAAYAGRADLATFFIAAIFEKRIAPEPAPDTTAPVDPATRQSRRVKLVEKQ